MNLEYQKSFLQLGLKDDKIVSIEDVENGKGCNCICPECKSPLLARNNGNIKVHHFAHISNTNCTGGIESALHLLSKEVLKETKKIYVPDYRFYYPDLKIESTLIHYNKILSFHSVELEEKIRIGNEIIIADALCEVQGKKIIIEFAKTHFIDEHKRKKLSELGMACIEIPISMGEQNKKELRKQLQSNYFKSVWIVNKKGENEIEANRIKLIKGMHAARKAQREEKRKRDKAKEEKLLKQQKIQQQKFQKEAELKERELDEASQKGNLILNCPIREDLRKEFRNKLINSHSIISKLFSAKEISPIYDRRPEFVDIFIDKERVFLVPPNYDHLNYNEKKLWDALYRLVCEFLDYRDNSNFNPCQYCKFFNGKTYEYIICTYDSAILPNECFRT